MEKKLGKVNSPGPVVVVSNTLRARRFLCKKRDKEELYCRPFLLAGQRKEAKTRTSWNKLFGTFQSLLKPPSSDVCRRKRLTRGFTVDMCVNKFPLHFFPICLHLPFHDCEDRTFVLLSSCFSSAMEGNGGQMLISQGLPQRLLSLAFLRYLRLYFMTCLTLFLSFFLGALSVAVVGSQS